VHYFLGEAKSFGVVMLPCLALHVKYPHYKARGNCGRVDVGVAWASMATLNRQDFALMSFGKLFIVAGLAATGLSFIATSPVHASACGANWAKTGIYKVTGNFRGKTESAGAELTRDCRINLKIPGVYTGGRVKKAGSCLRFTFKIDKERRLYKGRWCDGYAVVDWKGKDVRARVKKVRQSAK
jgi:hypothetical protein